MKSVLLLFLFSLVASGYIITVPRHGSSCGNFQTSMYFKDCEDWGNGNRWEGSVPDGIYTHDILQYFCSGEVATMPQGSYCFMMNNRYGTETCPPGFTSGTRIEEEENDWNISFFLGFSEARPKVTYTYRSTSISWYKIRIPKWHFCCGSGDPATPISFDAITQQLPPKFFLFRKGGACQIINGRNVTSGYVYFDDEDGANDNAQTGTIPDGTFDADTLYHYCAYEPSPLPSPVLTVQPNDQTATTASLSWESNSGATVYQLRLHQGTTLVQSFDGYTDTSISLASLSPATQYTLTVYSGVEVNGSPAYETIGKVYQFTTCATGSAGIPCEAFCDPECVRGSCSATSTCICETGWAGAICDKCNTGFFPSISECAECPTCSGHGRCSDGPSGTGECACSPGYNGSNCESCEAGYYSSASDCLACDSNCLTCEGSATTCTECQQGFDLQGSICVPICTGPTYLNETVCAHCDPSCLTCFGGSSSQCLTCPESSYKNGNSCPLSCPGGTYADDSRVCTACPLNCATCSLEAGAIECATCLGNYLLQGTTCITPAQCTASGGYAAGNACAVCDSSCATCTGAGSSSCTSCHDNEYWLSGACVASCPAGTFVNSPLKTCQPCSSPCATCPDAHSCSSCSAPYFLSGPECVPTCPSNTLPDASTQRCVPCDDSCQTCSGSTDFCTSCADEAQSIDNGECLDSCPIGKFADALMQCQLCYPTCATCTSSSPGDCLTCLPTTYREGDECVTACSPYLSPDEDRVCQPIYCEAVSTDGVSYPTTQITHTAAGICPTGTSGQISRQCNLSQGAGVWAAPVGSCNPCPAGYYQDVAGQLICKPCRANSNSSPGSDSPSDCTCLPGYQLQGDECVAITCPAITLQNATFPLTLAGSSALGSCAQGYRGNPTMQCSITGTWSMTVLSPCILDTTPQCRNPSSCQSASLSLCNACYRSGGFVDPNSPNACTCPATSTVYLPSSGYVCTPAIALCAGTYICDESCLTCAGPSNTQCLTCSDPTKVLVASGSNAFGRCLAPCLANQYRDSNGVCVNFNCAALSNCNGLGTCTWNGVQPTCQCVAGFEGPDCSIPTSCPALNNCTSPRGTCTLNKATGDIYCSCILGWTGPTCNTQAVFSYSPPRDLEIGGQLMTIVTNETFSPTDEVKCTFGKISVTGYASSTGAFCVIPPATNFLFRVPLTLTVNGVSKILGNFEYQYSNKLPIHYFEIPQIMWPTNTPRVYNYSTTNVYKMGGPTVSVQLFRWDWNPYRDIEALGEEEAILNDLGIIATGPNTGAIAITLTLPNNEFNWTSGLYVVSIFSSKSTHRFYAVPFPSTDTYESQCDYWHQNAWDPIIAFADCPPHTAGLIQFDYCPNYLNVPTSVAFSLCYSRRFREDNCHYKFDGYFMMQVWEPYKPTDFRSLLVQYFMSAQLPKIFCCPLQAIHCAKYNSRRALDIAPVVKKRSETKVNPYRLALAYGDPHFITLDGVHYTFNGVGEFTLLQKGDFVVQIRTKKMDTGNAATINAIAIKYEDSIFGAYYHEPSKSFALVFNGDYQSEELETGDHRILPGGKVTVTKTEAGLRVATPNTFAFDLTIVRGAISVEVAAEVDSLASGGFLGLVGSVEGALAFKNGTTVASDATSEELHPVGVSWRVDDPSSLFVYPTGKSYWDYQDVAFVPDFPETLPEDAVFSTTARQICQAAAPEFQNDCYFDVVQSKSYEASSASLEMSELYEGFKDAYNQPPIMEATPASLSVRLNQEVQVTVSVSDPEGHSASVFVTSNPTLSGVFDPSQNRYSFSVTEQMYLAPSLPRLEFTAVDEKEATSTLSMSVTVKRSTCSDSMTQLAAEVTVDLKHRCPASATTCSATCEEYVESLAALTCISDLEPLIEEVYGSAKALCPLGGEEAGSLSPGVWAGVAVGAAVLVLLAAVGGFFAFKKLRSPTPARKESTFELRDDSTDAVVQLYSDPRY